MSYQCTDADEPAIMPDDASLFDVYGQAIFAYLRMHTRSREDAEDLTMEVFLAALENNNLSEIPATGRLGWLRKVSHNKLVDTYRRATRRQVIGLDTVAEKLFESDTKEPEQLTLKRETASQLYEVIAKLPLLQQQILCLRYADELRYAEIAILVDKREDAVRKILSRTLSTLRVQYIHSFVERG